MLPVTEHLKLMLRPCSDWSCITTGCTEGGQASWTVLRPATTRLYTTFEHLLYRTIYALRETDLLGREREKRKESKNRETDDLSVEEMSWLVKEREKKK